MCMCIYIYIYIYTHSQHTAFNKRVYIVSEKKVRSLIVVFKIHMIIRMVQWVKGIELSNGRVLTHTELHVQSVSVTHPCYKVPGSFRLKIKLRMIKQ